MSCSTARLAAHRANSQKSIGPRTVEGKAVSRLNACAYGLAGQGDLPVPGEDLALIAARTEAFTRQLGATGTAGRILAHRAALLSVE